MPFRLPRRFPWLLGGDNKFSFAANFTITAVPEPTSASLLLPGLIGLLALRTRS
jgi:hypothetical protein